MESFGAQRLGVILHHWVPGADCRSQPLCSFLDSMEISAMTVQSLCSTQPRGGVNGGARREAQGFEAFEGLGRWQWWANTQPQSAPHMMSKEEEVGWTQLHFSRAARKVLRSACYWKQGLPFLICRDSGAKTWWPKSNRFSQLMKYFQNVIASWFFLKCKRIKRG